MIPTGVTIRVDGGRLRISPASGIPAEILDEIRQNRATAVRLIEAGPEFDPVVLLNEFAGDLANIERCTDEQLRQAVEIAARWHGWRPRR